MEQVCCSARKIKSNSLIDMGFSDSDKNCAIRVSIGATTTKMELEKFVRVWSRYKKKKE